MFRLFKNLKEKIKNRKSRKNQEDEAELSFEERYGRYRKGLGNSDRDHLAVELCEQMIDTSRELENTRDEYRMVMNYLADIQTIEDIPVTRRAALTETAEQIRNLNTIRDQFLETRSRISESQFVQMQEEQEQVPRSLKRLEANETYLSLINRDLSTLEGEKLSWNIEKKKLKKEMRSLRNMSIIFLLLFAAILVLYLALTYLMDLSLGLPMLIVTFLIALMACICLIRYQDCQKEIRQCETNINHAITLENHVKIKYVNIRNAVDYTCEKYHISNSKELVYIYEQYLDAVKVRKQFRDANDDLAFYSEKLIRQLGEYHLYDPAVWCNHIDALCDTREMVELKHSLLARRQKLRTRLEYNLMALNEMKEKTLQSLSPNDKNRPQIEEIIRRLERINKGEI